MKVDAHMTPDWHQIPNHVRNLEAQGYDGVGTAEMNHDPFMPLLLAQSIQREWKLIPALLLHLLEVL